MLKANAHDDTYEYNCFFDACPWFEQASDEELLALAECDFGGDHPANIVAEFFEEDNDEIHRLKRYGTGFSVQINPFAALQWLQSNAPEVYRVAKGLTVWSNDQDVYDPEAFPFS